MTAASVVRYALAFLLACGLVVAAVAQGGRAVSAPPPTGAVASAHVGAAAPPASRARAVHEAHVARRARLRAKRTPRSATPAARAQQAAEAVHGATQARLRAQAVALREQQPQKRPR